MIAVPGPWPLRRWTLALAGAAVAVLLVAVSLRVHLRSACIELDTPYLPLCAAPPTDPAELRTQLRQRIARNPGDATAWTRLLVAEPAEHSGGVLRGAAVVAPYNHNVARWRAAAALESGRLPEGVSLLVEILRHRSSADSAKALAQLATSSDGLQLLRPHLREAREWLPQVLAASYAMKVSPVEVLPLVAQAVEQGGLPGNVVRSYMRTLKAGGYWLDAYGLWLAQHKELVPLLYNGGFDQALEADGFDWEFAAVPRSRAGALFEQQAVARRGLVLGIEFTGRSFAAPLVRQYVFAGPGAYRLRGEYMASKLRTEEGLAWTVQCTAGRKTVAGRTQPLKDTGGVWKPLTLEFVVPPDCGVVASVQLEPAAQYEAAAGMRGHVAFDAFSLTRAIVSQ
jgi:hypothetical protein